MLGVVGGDPGPALQAGVEAGQPVELEGGLDLVEPAVDADHVVQAAVDAVLAVVAEHADPAAGLLVPGDDGAALAGHAERLDLHEGVEPGVPHSPAGVPSRTAPWATAESSTRRSPSAAARAVKRGMSAMTENMWAGTRALVRG